MAQTDPKEAADALETDEVIEVIANVATEKEYDDI